MLSVKCVNKSVFTKEKTGERPETMTRKDAMMFPVIASCALFGLYIFFHIFSKEYINLLLSFYFLVLGIFALSHMMSPIILKLIPSAVPVIPFHLKFTQVTEVIINLGKWKVLNSFIKAMYHFVE